MLRRGEASEAESPPTGRNPRKDGKSARRRENELPASAEWKLGGDLGRRYGAVSGDRNPIHMHSLTAKPLGFPAAIAHGMWTKARCLAQLESRLPEGFGVEVRFRKPILLPARVEFASSDMATGSTSPSATRSRRPHTSRQRSLEDENGRNK